MFEHDPAEQGSSPLETRDLGDDVLNGHQGLLLDDSPVARVIDCVAPRGRIITQRRVAALRLLGNRVVHVR